MMDLLDSIFMDKDLQSVKNSNSKFDQDNNYEEYKFLTNKLKSIKESIILLEKYITDKLI